MLILNLPKDHLRHILLYEYARGNSAMEAFQNIKTIYGDEATTLGKCHFWYKKFKSGDLSLKDLPRTGRSSTFDDKSLLAMILENNNLGLNEISKHLNTSKSTVHSHLKKLGFRWMHGKWIAHNKGSKAKGKETSNQNNEINNSDSPLPDTLNENNS